MSDLRELGQKFRRPWTDIQNRGGGQVIGGASDSGYEAPQKRGDPMGSQFGITDLGLGKDYGRRDFAGSLEKATGRDVTGVLGFGKTDPMLEAVNELALEWQMEPFASLEEVSDEFIDRLEGMLR